jgi:hypothetical protein
MPAGVALIAKLEMAPPVEFAVNPVAAVFTVRVSEELERVNAGAAIGGGFGLPQSAGRLDSTSIKLHIETYSIALELIDFALFVFAEIENLYATPGFRFFISAVINPVALVLIIFLILFAWSSDGTALAVITKYASDFFGILDVNKISTEVQESSATELISMELDDAFAGEIAIIEMASKGPENRRVKDLRTRLNFSARLKNSPKRHVL